MNTSNPAAVLARMKWDGMTARQKKAEVARLQAARHAATTAEERSEIARKAARKRWGKKKVASPKSNGSKD